MLFSCVFKGSLFAEGEEIRHLWLHYIYYATNDDDRHEFFDKAESMGINAIFLIVYGTYDARPEYFQALVDSVKNRNMKLFIAYPWEMKFIERYNTDSKELEPLWYRPLNLSEEQWKICIENGSYKERSSTSALDKNNPNSKEFIVNEIMKFINNYPEIDGVVWDYSRMGGLLGSFHTDAQNYISQNSDIDIELIKNEIYGKFPVPAFRMRGATGSAPTTCKVLSRYYSESNIDYLGITLQEHSNNGSCLCLNRNDAAFEMPIYSEVCKTMIRTSNYSGDTVYVKKETGLFEFPYSMGYITKFVKDAAEVPNGAPYIIVDGLSTTLDEIVELQNLADSGSCVIFGQPPYYLLNQLTPPQEVIDLVGFKKVKYNELYLLDESSLIQYSYLTDEGKKYNFSSSDFNINNQIQIAKKWMDWNANEMLGGTLRKMKTEMKKLGDKRRLNIACTKYYSDPHIQQQDWATWLKNGYIDFDVMMLYQNNLSEFQKYLDRTPKYFEDSDLLSNYVQPILGMQFNYDSPEILVEQATYSTNQYNFKGVGFFEGPTFLTSFTEENGNYIRDRIGKDKIPEFYYPQERPMLYPYSESGIIKTDIDQINFGINQVDSIITQNINIKNIGNNYLDIVDISMVGSFQDSVNFTIDKSSILLSPGEEITVQFTFESKYPLKLDTELKIWSNDSNQEFFLIPLRGEFRKIAPKIDTNRKQVNLKNTIIKKVSTENLSVFNLGIDTLLIYKIEASIKDSVFQYEYKRLDLSPIDTLEIGIIFKPTSNITYNDTIKIYSNDQENRVLSIPIIGTGDFPPKLFIKTK